MILRHVSKSYIVIIIYGYEYAWRVGHGPDPPLAPRVDPDRLMIINYIHDGGLLLWEFSLHPTPEQRHVWNVLSHAQIVQERHISVSAPAAGRMQAVAWCRS